MRGKGIKRRDFINGVCIGTGATLLSPLQVLANDKSKALSGFAEAEYYPPTLTGMRGSHEGSFEVAHALAWQGKKPDTYKNLGEHYDLIVVGAGMSGLAAALFYQQAAGTDARILLLDNHDDFGGHAKRNEFHHAGKMVLSLGGAQNLENPDAYSAEAKALLASIGVDETFLDTVAEKTPASFALAGNLGEPIGLSLPDGADRALVNGPWMNYHLGEDGFREAIRQLPIAKDQQQKLISLIGGDRDYLEDMSLSEMYEYLNTTSYNRFLTERVGLSTSSLALFDDLFLIYFGFTGWNLSILEAIGSGAPGIRAMGWLGSMAGAATLAMADSLMEIRMLPDGNATIARLLVQRLIPAVAPNMRGVEDVAVTHFNYAALDQPDQTTRLRLNSTVVGVRESDEQTVEVDYVCQGAAQRVTAERCILACYNGIIPHLCPQLPEEQKRALRYGVKIPFIYANVLLRDGRAFSELGTTLVRCPMDPFKWISAAPTMTVGGYQPPQSPEDPMALFMAAAPTPAPQGTESLRDLLRIGRHSIYSTPFATYEQQIRDQLQAILGPHGFNNETDIEAITVNRIPHGYAYEYMALEDAEWPEGQAPNEIGRKQFGRISIANSDSEARAYMDAAFDAAWRAVQEQTSG